MSMFAWVIFGIIAGGIASYTMHSDAEQSTMADMLLGVVGSLLGGFLMSFFAESGILNFNISNFFIALIGSIALIFMGRLLPRRTNY